MKVRVLGTAGSGGVPQWNCGGDGSVRARAEDPQVPARTQSSIAVGSGDGRWSLVGASPDLREQLTRFQGLHPRPGTRDIPIDTIVLTSADLDQVMGLLVLREALPYRIVTTAWIRDALLEHNAAFRLLAPAFGPVALDEPFDLDREGRLEAKLFPVPGQLPGYLADLVSASAEATLGLRVTDRETGRRLLYAPRLAALGEGTLAELQAGDVRFVDGTFFDANELLDMRPGAPDAGEMGHVPIGGPHGSLPRLRLMRGRTFYVHINATNPILDGASKEAARVRQAGIEIPGDGLELTV